jgi:hypothetical protein
VALGLVVGGVVSAIAGKAEKRQVPMTNPEVSQTFKLRIKHLPFFLHSLLLHFSNLKTDYRTVN